MFAPNRCRSAVDEGIQYCLVELAFVAGFSPPGVTYAQSGHHDTYAFVKAFAADPEGDQYSSQDADKAYDQASATWMQFFGDSAVVAARTPILIAMDAMRHVGWLCPNTNVVISMLDARGDFAQFDGERCSVHVNINDHGSSPIIAALGNLRSSVAFVAAHELAHCRFDTLPISERFPDRQQLRALGFSKQLAISILNVLSHPNDEHGSAAFLTAYEESLADAAAAIALTRAETLQQHFGTALENAQSLRFGELFTAHQGAIPTAEHQGGFVFESVARQIGSDLSWRFAKQVAMQSVLLSSFYLATEPKWYKILVGINSHQAQEMRRTWTEKAHGRLEMRRSAKDENLFYSATSDAFFSIEGAQYTAENSDLSADAALMRWKEVAYLSSETKSKMRQQLSAHAYRKSPIQAIVSKRNQGP